MAGRESDKGDRLAPEAGGAFGKGGLIGEGGDHAKGIAPGDIGGGEDGRDPGPRGIGDEIAKGEGRMRMGGADRLENTGIFRHDIGPEQIARHLFGPVEAGDRLARRAALGQGRCGGIGGVADGGQDLAIAGATAEDAADGGFGLCLGRGGIAGEEFGGGHQHPGRADAALRRAMAQEGGAEAGEFGGVGLDRLDLAPLGPGGGGEAGAGGAAVDQHGAGAAIPGIAADLGAGQAEVFAQNLGQAAGGGGVAVAGGAVQDEARHGAQSRTARRRSSAAESIR